MSLALRTAVKEYPEVPKKTGTVAPRIRNPKGVNMLSSTSSMQCNKQNSKKKNQVTCIEYTVLCIAVLTNQHVNTAYNSVMCWLVLSLLKC